MTGDFFTYVYPHTGDIVTFCRTASGDIYSRVDDAFCRANGFRDRAHLEAEVNKEGVMLPEWMLWHSELMNTLNLN